MNSNLNLVTSFIILMRKQWNSQHAVRWKKQQNFTQSGCESLGLSSKIYVQAMTPKSPCGPLQTMNSNLNLVSSSIILMRRQCTNQDAVRRRTRPNLTQSGCEILRPSSQNYVYPWHKSHLVVTIADNEFHSQPSHSIYYTQEETMY